MSSQANPVQWFEIPVNDLAAAKQFYEAVLGLELTESEMGPNQMAFFPMVQEASGSTGALVRGEGYQPSTAGTLVYFHVGQIDATLEKIEANGGKTLLPRTSIGEYGHIAHFQDPEGNRVALHDCA